MMSGILTQPSSRKNFASTRKWSLEKNLFFIIDRKQRSLLTVTQPFEPWSTIFKSYQHGDTALQLEVIDR